MAIPMLLLALAAHAQDASPPTPASLRRLARCYGAWAAHSPPPDRQGPCDRHGWDCVDPPPIDPADAVLARCIEHDHGPTPALATQLDEAAPLTPLTARAVAACLRARAEHTPIAIDVLACSAIPLALSGIRGVSGTEIGHGVRLRALDASFESIRISPLETSLRAEAATPLAACAAANGPLDAAFIVVSATAGCAASHVPTATSGGPTAAAIDCVEAALVCPTTTASPGSRILVRVQLGG